MERLGKLFGSPARLRLLRLFLFNQDTSFSLAEAASRSSLDSTVAKREISDLHTAGLLVKRGSRAKTRYQVNGRFEHLEAFDAFIRDTTVLSSGHILGALKKAGTLRVIALSGLFTGALEAQIDLLVAGDNIDMRALAKAIKGLEAELGREIRYAAFETPDFRYRLGVYDRLLRDVFDYPHRLLIDRIGL
jgi:hypothetical protein